MKIVGRKQIYLLHFLLPNKKDKMLFTIPFSKLFKLLNKQSLINVNFLVESYFKMLKFMPTFK